MAHDTIISPARGPLGSALALLLGALACSDSGMDMAAANPSGTPAQMTPSAGAAPAEQAPPGAEPGPSAPAAANGSSEEGVGANPIMLGEQDGAGSASAGADEGTEATEPGSADTPGASDTSGAPPGAEAAPASDASTSLARGDAPTIESATASGPFDVTTVTAGLRDGPDYGSQTLFVPEGVEPPFAAVVIVPGFNTPESSIQAWGPFLASHGIVALTIGTNTPTDSAEARSRAVLDALETVKAENTRAGGPLEGKLAVDNLGAMGWSLGGGGLLIAESSTPSLKAAITMAAFSPGGQFPQIQTPTLFLAGSADPNAGGQSQGLFASLPETTPKMLFEVEGGPHEVGNDPENAGGEIGRYGLSWLEVFLVGDARYLQFLEQMPTQASDFRENLTSAP